MISPLTIDHSPLSAKPHYQILDGLRGVAALMVVAFHIFEAHSTSHLDQVINHGYLAVDFFFLLSGFVVGYAYDDRWQNMSIGVFFKRRLIRLQPMVVMGMTIGALLFYFQDSPVVAPHIHEVPVWKMLGIMLIGFTLLPVLPSMDIRGWHEMHPLNGPGWSLFYEYIANILYALFVRRFSKTLLAIFVLLAGAFLLHCAVTSEKGDVIGGWSLEPQQIKIGFARLLYPFFAGLLLSRTATLIKVKNGFLWCALLVIIILAMPRIGGAGHLWANGLFDSLSIILIFPFIVFLGASSSISNKNTKRVCKFLGDISYPIYITHYPLIYWYTGWVYDNKKSFREALPISLLVFFTAIAIGYACLKLFDEPVRNWLKKKMSA